MWTDTLCHSAKTYVLCRQRRIKTSLILAIVTLVDDVAGFFFMLENCYLSAWVNQRPVQLQMCMHPRV